MLLLVIKLVLLLQLGLIIHV